MAPLEMHVDAASRHAGSKEAPLSFVFCRKHVAELSRRLPEKRTVYGWKSISLLSSNLLTNNETILSTSVSTRFDLADVFFWFVLSYVDILMNFGF